MDLLEKILHFDQYKTAIDRARAQAILTIVLMALVLYTVYVTASRLWVEIAAGTSIWALSVPAFYITLALILIFLRAGRLRVAEFGPPLMPLLGVIPATVFGGMVDTRDVLLLGLFIMLATLFKRRRGLIGSLALAIILLTISIAWRERLPNLPPSMTPEHNLMDFGLVTLELIAIGGLLTALLQFMQVSQAEGEARVQGKRVALAEITSSITRQISHQLPLQETMDNAVELIATSFTDIYHAQIFLLNELNTQAELFASTGEVGKLLKQRRHSLKVGGHSVIGQVMGAQSVVVAYAGAADTIHRHNDLLPNTAVEAAFPLRVGDRLIGALDLQSRSPDAFPADDLLAFQGLADHLAIAIDNARLFDEAEETIRQNRNLIEQSRANTEEVLHLNRRLTRQIWADHLRGKTDNVALNIDFGNNTKEYGGAWTHTLREALQSNHTIHQHEDGRQVVAVPVRVRGEVIGAMEFELDEVGQLTPEDLLMIEEISEQLGLAAENTRLYENTQRSAQREALVNQIAARIQETNQIDATLAVTARHLQEALKAERVTIRLGTPPAINPRQSGGGE